MFIFNEAWTTKFKRATNFCFNSMHIYINSVYINSVAKYWNYEQNINKNKINVFKNSGNFYYLSASCSSCFKIYFLSLKVSSLERKLFSSYFIYFNNFFIYDGARISILEFRSHLDVYHLIQNRSCVSTKPRPTVPILQNGVKTVQKFE